MQRPTSSTTVDGVLRGWLTHGSEHHNSATRWQAGEVERHITEREQERVIGGELLDRVAGSGATGWGALLAAPFVGSFLGVVVRRLPEGRPIAWVRSRWPLSQPIAGRRSGSIAALAGGFLLSAGSTCAYGCCPTR